MAWWFGDRFRHIWITWVWRYTADVYKESDYLSLFNRVQRMSSTEPILILETEGLLSCVLICLHYLACHSMTYNGDTSVLGATEVMLMASLLVTILYKLKVPEKKQSFYLDMTRNVNTGLKLYHQNNCYYGSYWICSRWMLFWIYQWAC